MAWFIGVDGGGTKTAFAVSGTDGVPAAGFRRSGCSYQSIGIDGAAAIIVEGVGKCLSAVGAAPAECGGCCVGVPCFGENAEIDRRLVAKLQTALPGMTIQVVNDAEVGWAGALECQAGIHLVAGTGSIAFGRGSDKKTARCGGWTEFFGDEGSCYHVGRAAMSLFSKEADGRAPRGALYELVCHRFKLTEDFQFVDVVLKSIAPHREAVADFQQLAWHAAQSGDTAAAALYADAADELALMAGALQRKLALPPHSPVSYSGGLFKAGDLILSPLRERIEALGLVLQAPKHSAEEGALILAIDLFKGRN